jgi:hypothetical protein
MRTRTAVLVLAAFALAGCNEVEEKETEGYEPSKLAEVKGSDSKRVTFTAEGARRVGLERKPVRSERGRKVVPYGALLYDSEGKTSVYVAATPLSFQRADVVVERIEGDRVFLRRGPAVGAQVVDQGSTEVYGTELEIAAG